MSGSPELLHAMNQLLLKSKYILPVMTVVINFIVLNCWKGRRILIKSCGSRHIFRQCSRSSIKYCLYWATSSSRTGLWRFSGYFQWNDFLCRRNEMKHRQPGWINDYESFYDTAWSHRVPDYYTNLMWNSICSTSSKMSANVIKIYPSGIYFQRSKSWCNERMNFSVFSLCLNGKHWNQPRKTYFVLIQRNRWHKVWHCVRPLHRQIHAK